ncbi:sugar dehydrogenase complex small subunit [Providencia sp.]
MLSRRRFIAISAVLTGYAILNPIDSFSTSLNPSSDSYIFIELSKFLTGRNNLSLIASERAFHNLVADDVTFTNKMKSLWDMIQTSKLTDISAFITSHVNQNIEFHDTATLIISAWYLGYTGTPISLRAHDNTRFVTYTDALMYQPTIDATVIPSYSRGHTNYWVNPPITIKND